MAVSAVLGYTFVDWQTFTSGGAVVMAVAMTVAVLVILLVTYFYWKGRNWARWFILFSSVLALWNLTLISSARGYMRAVLIVEAVFFGSLLVWLNTREFARTSYAALHQATLLTVLTLAVTSALRIRTEIGLQFRIFR